jgi:LmbE family N-acetylglucosaminyl deacetylase
MEIPLTSLKHSKCAVIVAHPDDETLWAGGTILMNPDNEWTVISTCRKHDPDRSPKYYAALKILNATGDMGNLDDGPEQMPLEKGVVETTILSLLKKTDYDLIITHSTQGEYTRHRRHEEVADAVLGLIESKRLTTKKLWMFAYEDGGREYLPKPIQYADKIVPLPPDIWNRKYQMITEIYGFHKESWEAKTTPKTETFWAFTSAGGVQEKIHERSNVQ